MNWVGGARSRIRQQSERRTQKEFFERRRLQKRARNARPPSPGDSHAKTVISQDLLLLQTLAHVHNAKQTERDAPRHVQAVNLEAKKPTFQQKMDLELPMSPIEKPSFLDLMDTSNMSLYHDLPRVSTEKVPPRHCASSRFGVVSDEATDGNPGVAGPGVARPDVARLAFTVAHKHTRPSRPQHKPAEPTHHLAATTLQNKHITKRQILDSETPFKFKSVQLPNVRAPPPAPDGKGGLLAFHRSQTSDREVIEMTQREVNVSKEQNVTLLQRRIACPSKSGTSGDNFNDQGSSCCQDVTTKPTSPSVPILQKLSEHNERQQGFKMPRMKEVDEEERGDDHCTRNDTTFNESLLRPLVERHSKRPPGQATTPPLQTQLGAKAPDKPMSTFEKMVMFFEKTETAPHKGPKPHPIPRPEEPCGSVHHERWRNFACQERSEQKGCTLTTHDLTVLTEQPIPQNTTTKTQGNRVPTHKTNGYNPIGYKRLKNTSVLDELMSLEYSPSCPNDDDILVSQDMTFPLEASENPIGHIGGRERIAISKVIAVKGGDKKLIRKGSIEVSGSEHPVHEEDYSKGSIYKHPVGTTDVGVQTELLSTHRDASCECDLQPVSTRGPALESSTADACTQTEVGVGDSVLEPRVVVPSAANEDFSSGARDAIADEKCGWMVQGREVAVQVSDPLMRTLHARLSALEADLGRAQSTVVWQSVMLRCLNDQF